MPRSVLLGRPWPAPGEPLFLPEDTDVALALHEQEAAEAAEKCPLCGLSTSVCRDPGNQFGFRVAGERCHATYALTAAQAKESGDDTSTRSTAWSAQLKSVTEQA